jgi:dTDP-4-amino-4,6-dideoxygalactose transaminase
VNIPFNHAVLTGDEWVYMAEAIPRHISGTGPFTRRCEELLQTITAAKSVLLTTSCTHALEMSALLLKDSASSETPEVIVPSFTFVSSAAAFALHGYKPVFVDIREDTQNLDETKLAELLTPQTRAVLPVHYGGVACAMDEIDAICKPRNIAVVEDNAHGLFGSYRNRPLGSIGSFSTLSFHETKNVCCGEVGALLINDEQYVERAEILRDKGTNRGSFYRGEVNKYEWMEIGSSHVLPDMLAAFLLAQLESRERLQSGRRRAWKRYRGRLGDWAGSRDVRLPQLPPTNPTYHLFQLIFPSDAGRDKVLDQLRAKGICAVFHYLPLHLSPVGRRYGYARDRANQRQASTPALVQQYQRYASGLRLRCA